MLTRREFIHAAAAGAATLTRVPALHAAKYDLVIAGGRVIDPASRLDRPMDVAITAGRIAAVRPRIAPSDAAEILDARGRLVVPGLIDIHLHARNLEMPKICRATGVTSYVDAGSQGADKIDEVVEVAKTVPDRLRILLNIAKTGILPEGDLMDIARADVEAARAAIARHKDVIVGIKARLSRTVAGNNDLEALRRAQAVARPLNLPVMIHVGDTVSPLPAILALLKPGDIVTHVYAPPPHGIFDDVGRVLPDVRAARRRGVLFDIGNGRIGHWTWATAESAIKQGFAPDTISSDLTDAGRADQVIDFPNVLSKYLLLGMPIDQVIARGTVNAARVFPPFRDRGTLRVGARADVTVLDLQDGAFEFVDNYQGKRTSRLRLAAVAVVQDGKRV